MRSISSLNIFGGLFSNPLKMVEIDEALASIGPNVYVVPVISFWQMFNSMPRERLKNILFDLSKRSENICLECTDESQYTPMDHDLLQSILKDTVSDPSKFYILTGGIGPAMDRVIYHDVFEKRTSGLYCRGERAIEDVESGAYLRDKTAICLNKRTAIHRLATVEYLLSIDNGRNFISCPDGFWDWLPDRGEVNGSLSLRELNDELNLDARRCVLNGIGDNRFYDSLPLVVDIPTHAIGINPPPSTEHKKVVFDYVTETQFDKDITFFTEKSYKPFAQMTIPIFIGTPGIVRALRDKGYRLNALDYGYDDILDHTNRFKAIMEVIKETQEMSMKELLDLYIKNVFDITHNYNLLLGKG